jgi:hypothetical protein
MPRKNSPVTPSPAFTSMPPHALVALVLGENVISYYVRITDPVGLTAFIEEIARKTRKPREFNSFCKLGKDSKDSL